jgi:hypothetical protein
MSVIPLHRSYYYLVTSLPDLAMEEKKAAQGCAAFMEEIADFIADDDLQLLRLIRLPFDNTNLITLLESRERLFEPNGCYSRDDLLQGIKTPALLPEYMQPLVEAHKEGRQLFPDLSREDQLNWLFYEEAIQHTNAFAATWFTFELNLRNVLAAVNVRNGLRPPDERGKDYEHSLASCLVCRNEVSEQILKSTAPDFGLSEALPWLEPLLELPLSNTTRREKVIDQVRWDMLDGLSMFTGFHIESILAFCLKLLIVERWSRLDPAEGRRRLEQLVGMMTERYKLSDVKR